MEGYLAEIRMFGGNFAPRFWATCSGQILSIAQNTALFSLLGTTFGGNGQTTFALPDFRSRIVRGTGQGPGLPDISLGEVSGSESTTLTINNLPAHNHVLTQTPFQGGKAQRPGTTDLPSGNYHSILANNNAYSTTADADMAPMILPNLNITGGSQPLNRFSPYLGMNIIICIEGIFPSRD